MRLGESLVEKGRISVDQLAKALNAQLIYGGHLGTCLIELGFLDEETLGTLLSEVFSVRYAHPYLLDDIPPPVIASISQAAVEKHQAIPFDMVQKTLHVAMIDPTNVASLDVLSFASGCRIEAWVSPEVRIFQAMERYYQVARRVRYIALARSLDQNNTSKRPMTAIAAATQGGVESAATLPPLVPIQQSAADVQPPPVATTSRPVPPPPLQDFEERLAHTAKEMCRAEDVTRVVQTVLNHAARDAARCVLFGITAGNAFILDSRGFKLDAASAHRIGFTVTSEPLLTLLSGEPYYRGPVPEHKKYRGFFEALQTECPTEILIMPVYRQDRIAALLYADGGTSGHIGGPTEAFSRLMRKFALVMDLLDLRGKILFA